MVGIIFLIEGIKRTLFEGGLRVPAIFRWPGKIKAGSTTNEVLTSLDLFPTFCKLADVDVTKLRLDGLDLSDVILRQNQIAKRDLFWELGAHKRLDRGAWTSVRSGDWKYLQDADGIEYLFNLQKDPYEKEDLSGQKTDVFLKMKSRRDALVRQYRPQPTLVE